MRSGPILVSVCALALAACGRAKVGAGAPDKVRVITLAVLPAESSGFPRLVDALNGSLSGVFVNGVGRVVISKVSLEVVQLSIECIEVSLACIAAVGKSLSADRLLYAQIEALPRERRAKSAPVKVKVTLFDVARNDVMGEAARTFASEEEAIKASRQLVNETVSVVPVDVKEAPVVR